MKKQETLKFKGRAILTATDPKTGKVVAVVKSKNIVCTVGKYHVGDMLIDRSTPVEYNTGLTYCTIGTNAAAVGAGDVALTAEAARKHITSRTRAANVITLATFFTALESKYAIEEAGIFGHSTASATPGSGTIFNHYLVSYDNSAGNYDITIDVIITIG